VKVTCYALEPGGGLRPEAEPAVVAGWRAGGGPYWVDLSSGRPEEALTWLAGLGLDPNVLDLLQIGDGSTRILPLAEAVFLVYPVAAADDAGSAARFTCLCLERLVVNLHDVGDGSSVVEQVPVAALKLREGTTAGVVCAMAVVHTGQLRRRVVSLRRDCDALAGRMDVEPRSVGLQEILGLKRRVLTLAGVADEELAVFEVLKLSNRAALPMSGLAEAFQVPVELIRAADRDIDRLDRRVSDLQRRYESAQQDVTNRRLGLLTILSAIFMPLTLIVGMYGMNFDVMPELRHPYGYPITLAGMALLAGGLYWFFWSRGWLK
jgi:Mg2+ and Co2+ transporter CorA